MTQRLSAREWFVFSSSEPSNKQTINRLFIVSLFIVTVTSIIRGYLLDYLQYQDNLSWCTDCTKPTTTIAIINGLRILLFHFILYFVLQFAYPDNSGMQRKQKVAFAAQLWSMADILFLFLYGTFAFLPGVGLGSYNYYELENNYSVVFAMATVLALFYIGTPIIERLKASFEDYSKVILATIILSAVIYWISYGLGWILGELILLPFGGA